jgi:hypothetical protein
MPGTLSIPRRHPALEHLSEQLIARLTVGR